MCIVIHNTIFPFHICHFTMIKEIISRRKILASHSKESQTKNIRLRLSINDHHLTLNDEMK